MRTKNSDLETQSVCSARQPKGKVHAQALQAALDAVVLQNLTYVSLFLSVLFALFSLWHWCSPVLIAGALIITTSISACLFFIFHLVARYCKIPTQYAHVAAFVLLGVVLANSFLSLMLTQDPLYTINFILLLSVAGVLLLSTPYFLIFSGLTLLVWGCGAFFASWDLSWEHLALVLLISAVFSIVIHRIYTRAYVKMESLRLQNEVYTADLQRRAMQLEMLVTTGRSINAVLDIDDLLDYVVNIVQERFGYDFVGVFLLDKAEEYVVIHAGTGEAGQQLIRDGFRLRVGKEGLIGWVSRYHHSVCVNDVTRDQRYIYTPALADTHSELALPLATSDAFFGVLDIQSNQPHAFHNDDVRVYRSLADVVATALENASRYQVEHSRRLLTETLYEVGRALSSTLDLREVLDLILDDLANILPFDRGSVLLHEREGVEIVSACGFPPESDPLQIRISLKDDDVFRQIYNTKTHLMIPEILGRSDWQQVDSLPQARSWLGIPLINTAEDVIGMLSLTRESPNPYTSDEVELAMAFAGQAAIALQNARLYSELEQAYEQLERLDRAKTDFITVASHELRTPLALLRGFSEVLLEDLRSQDTSEHLHMVEGICAGAVRLHEIVDRMVSMAEIDSRSLKLSPVKIELPVLIREVVDGFSEVLEERDLSLHLEGRQDLLLIEADYTTLHKALTHLLVNAIKYTPDGGSITITTLLLEADSAVEVIVQDTGIGIDPDAHDLIFSKFYHAGEVAFHSSGTTKFKGGGPGLGLAIVRGIVEAHNGSVWVESKGYDEETCPGSSFHVRLPLKHILETYAEPSEKV